MDEKVKKELLLQQHNPFIQHNNMRVTELDENRCEAELIVTEHAYNPFGTVHGGALFTLADLCCGVAARADGRHYVTENADIAYLRPAAGDKITAVAEILHRGRSRCVIEVRLRDAQSHKEPDASKPHRHGAL